MIFIPESTAAVSTFRTVSDLVASATTTPLPPAMISALKSAPVSHPLSQHLDTHTPIVRHTIVEVSPVLASTGRVVDKSTPDLALTSNSYPSVLSAPSLLQSAIDPDGVRLIVRQELKQVKLEKLTDCVDFVFDPLVC